MKSKNFLSLMLLIVFNSTLTKTELYQENTQKEQQDAHQSESYKATLTPEVVTCFNQLGFYFYDDMGSEARSVYAGLQENTLAFSYSTLIPALVQIVDLADKKSLLEKVAPTVQVYFAQLAAEESKKQEEIRSNELPMRSVHSGIPHVLDLLVSQSLQVGSYLAVSGVAVINKLAVIDALCVPANSISGAALIDNSVPDCKLQTITTPGKVANSATTATSSNIPNTIVLRDSNGNFVAGTITADLNGTATNAINCLNCPVAVGTPLNVPDTLVQRDGTGSFAAQDITLDGNISVAQDITVAGNIDITTNPSTATDGNILKAGSLFIHNFAPVGNTTNTFVGFNSGNTTLSGTGNTALGNDTLQANTSGSGNTAVGANALNANTTAPNNTAVGAGALEDNTMGNGNTAVGVNALSDNTLGVNNTAVGAFALESNTIGSFNIAIGSIAGSNLTTGNNNIYVGEGVQAAISGESTTIRIGTTQTATFIAGIFNSTPIVGDQVFVNASGQVGTVASSRRYKDNIAPMADDTQALLELEPVTFTYKDKDGSKQYGLIAEEVAEKFPDLVIFKDGQPESVRYHLIAVMMLNEMKKLAVRVDKQQEIIDGYAEQIRQLHCAFSKNQEVKA